MVDFPNSPVDGTTHTENGTQWVYRDPPGGWQVVNNGGLQEEVHNPDRSGYRIVGKTLECWGLHTDAVAGDTSISFPKTFARAPIVTVVAEAGVGESSMVSFWVNSASASSAVIERRSSTGGGTPVDSALDVAWRAVGEWDGIS